MLNTHRSWWERPESSLERHLLPLHHQGSHLRSAPFCPPQLVREQPHPHHKRKTACGSEKPGPGFLGEVARDPGRNPDSRGPALRLTPDSATCHWGKHQQVITSIFLSGMKGHQHLPPGALARTEPDRGYESTWHRICIALIQPSFPPPSPASHRLKSWMLLYFKA